MRALDDRGEREQISSAWREGEPNPPYPPNAVHERSQRLRERLQWRRGAFLVLLLLVGITGGLGVAGQAIPDALFGALCGVGIGVVVAFLVTNPWAEDQMRVLQLYDLLKQVNGDSEPVA